MGDITIPAAVITHAFVFGAGFGFAVVLLYSLGAYVKRQTTEAGADD